MPCDWTPLDRTVPGEQAREVAPPSSLPGLHLAGYSFRSLSRELGHTLPQLAFAGLDMPWSFRPLKLCLLFHVWPATPLLRLSSQSPVSSGNLQFLFDDWPSPWKSVWEAAFLSSVADLYRVRQTLGSCTTPLFPLLASTCVDRSCGVRSVSLCPFFHCWPPQDGTDPMPRWSQA